MHCCTIAIRLLFVCTALGVHASADEPAATKQSLPDLDSHFHELRKRAETAFETGKFEQARGLLLQAWALQPTPDVALALAQSEFELKRYRDSAEHFDFAIHGLDESQHEKALSLAKKALAEAKTQIAVLRVTTNRAGAEIRVDGTTVGKAPLESPLYLNPGTHELAARSSDAGIARPVSVQAGQESSLSLPIVSQASRTDSPWAAGAPRATDTPEATATEPQSRSIAPVIVGGAVFLAGVTTGIVFRLDSDSQFNNANAIRARLSSTGCQGLPSTQADCAALADAARNGDRSRNWSTAGFLVAAGALLGTGFYWYWPRSNGNDTAEIPNRVKLNAAIVPHTAGLVISGDY